METTTLTDTQQRVDRWLAPISDASPVGDDQRYEPAHESLRAVIASLDRPEEVEVDWKDFTSNAEALLSTRSKDLVIACYFAYALLQTEGILGLTNGMKLLSGILEKYWESCFPALKRVRGRINAIEWFVERISIVLANTEDTTNASKLSEETERFTRLVSSCFADNAPSTRPLLDAVQRIAMTASANGVKTQATDVELAPETQGATQAESVASPDSIAAAQAPIAIDPKQAKIAALKQPFAQPIAGPHPAGEDPRYDETREALQREMQKLTRAAGVEIEWESIRQDAQIFLTQRAKDIGVASYFAVAAHELGGIQGLIEGISAINAFLEHYWENGFPEAKRIRARANSISWFVERIESLGDVIPAADQKEQVETLDLAVQELVHRVSERFGDNAPALRQLSANVERVKLSLVSSTAAALQPAPAAATTTTSPDQVQPQSSQQPATSAQVQSVQLDAPQAELTDPEQVQQFLRTVGASLHKASRELFKVSVANPLAYRLCRMGLYLHFSEPPPSSNGNQTAVPPPPADREQQLNSLMNAQNWTMLLDEAESALGPSRMWLDLHRYVVIALEALGHIDARAAVISELGCLVQRLPRLLDQTFSNGQAFADDNTRQWIAGEVGGSLATPVATGESSGLAMDNELREAHQLATGGKLEEALARLTAVIESESVVGRDGFRAKLAMAQACSAAGSHALAEGIFAGLNGEIERFQLEQWEPSLAEACYCGRYEALQSMTNEGSNSKDEMANVYRQLCRIAPATALKLSKRG